MEGAAVTVYERDMHPAARLLGGSLDLHKATGQKALEKAGLPDAFTAVPDPSGNEWPIYRVRSEWK